MIFINVVVVVKRFLVVNALGYIYIKIHKIFLKIQTVGRQTSWLFASMTEELNKDLQKKKSSLLVRARLELASPDFKSGALTTLPRCLH